jgi:hypothetical protein
MLLAVLEFLLPGYAWLLVSGLHKRMSRLEMVLLSFVLSLCFSSLLAAALTFVTADYLLVTATSMVVGALIVIAGFMAVHTPTFPKTVHLALTTGSRALDFSIFAYAILIIGLFWSAPYYPTAQAPDLLTHAAIARAITTGQGRVTLLHVDLPIGLHFAAAIVSSLSGIGALEALRVVASAILLASIPLVFFSAREVLEDSKAAGMAVLVAAFALPADALHLVRIGTFPNLMSDGIILTVVWLVFRYVKQPSRALGLTIAFLGVGGAFVHSSFLILLAVLWVTVPFALFLFKGQARNYAKAMAYSTIGLAIFALIASFSFQANLQRVAAAYFLVGGISVMRIALSEFTRNLLIFLGPVNVLAIACAAIFAISRKRGIGLTFVLVWLVLMIPGAFLSGQAYRFILFAMLPGAYLLGRAIAEPPAILFKVKAGWMSRLTNLVAVMIFLLLVLSGAFPSIAAQSLNPAGRNYQTAVYDSMTWLQHSTSCVGGAASVGLWPDYEYLPALTGVPYFGDFSRPADYVLQKSDSLGFHCIVVSKTNQYFQQFNNNSAFDEKYQNQLTAIFIIR